MTASIIKELLQSPDAAIKRIYGEYRTEFFHWANREYSSHQEDAADVFQEAIIIFYKNVRTGKLQQLDASLKTYLFGIGKNLLLNRIKRNKREQPLSSLPSTPSEKTTDPYSKKESQDHQKAKIAAALNQLGETCRRIITLFYYRRYSTEAIKIEMGYKDEVTVRNRKLQCMKKLKEKVEKG